METFLSFAMKKPKLMQGFKEFIMHNEKQSELNLHKLIEHFLGPILKISEHMIYQLDTKTIMIV